MVDINGLYQIINLENSTAWCLIAS